jgi:hypothetical protein
MNYSTPKHCVWNFRAFAAALLISHSAQAAAASATTTPVVSKAVPGISQVALAWSKVDGASSYSVYYSLIPGKAETLAVPAQNNIIETNTVVGGLEEVQETPVYFVVRAVVSGKLSDASNEVTATPSKNATPDVVVLTPKDGQITLNWSSIGATSYEVDIGTNFKELTPIADLSAIAGNTATVSKLTNGTTYFFVVKAITGSVVTRSRVVWETPIAAVPAPVPAKPGKNVGASCIPNKDSAIAGLQNKSPSGSPNNAQPQPTSNVSGADVLTKFSTSASSGATLATAQIVRGYINAWMKPDKTMNCGITNAISVEVTATAPVTTATFTDYAREEMLGRRSGIINIYFNPFAGRDANDPYYNWNDRKLASDHIYIATPFRTVDSKMKSEASSTSWDEALSFYSFGIGGRGVKTASQGSKTAAVGTAYFGYGIDGPFHDTSSGTASGASTTAQSGGLSVEAYVTGNIANRNSLNAMFGITDASKSYATYGAVVTFWVTGKLFFSLEYDQGIGAFANRVLRNESLFRFGYGNPTNNSTTPTQPTANKPGS